jgi:hypothetical protein
MIPAIPEDRLRATFTFVHSFNSKGIISIDWMARCIIIEKEELISRVKGFSNWDRLLCDLIQELFSVPVTFLLPIFKVFDSFKRNTCRY